LFFQSLHPPLSLLSGLSLQLLLLTGARGEGALVTVRTWLLRGGGEETALAPGDALRSSTLPLERSRARGERLDLGLGDLLERARGGSGETDRAAGEECLRFLLFFFFFFFFTSPLCSPLK